MRAATRAGGVARRTPVSANRIFLGAEDVTARLRLDALRLLLRPSGPEHPGMIDEAFARLLLSRASLANLCAALQLSESEVLSQLGLVVGQLG